MDLIKKSVEILKNGGIVIFPTETVYGIGCKMSSAEGVKKIYEIKKREPAKPFLLHLSDIEMINKYIENYDESFFRKFNGYIPGPLSFVMKQNKEIDMSYLNGGMDTIGFRVPDNDIIREIIRELGEPVIGTSVNFSGEPPAKDIKEISEEIKKQLDLIIDDGEKNGVPSTVISMLGEKPEILRKGSRWEDIYNEFERTM